MTLPDGAYEPCSWSEIREHFQKYGSDHVYFHDATRWRPTISGDRDFVEMALEGRNCRLYMLIPAHQQFSREQVIASLKELHNSLNDD